MTKAKQKVTIPGMVGWSLLETAQHHGLLTHCTHADYDWDYDTTGLEAVADMFDSAIWSTGVNNLGLPAGVIGTGFVEDRPAAIQVIGQRWREDLICDALEAIEMRNGTLPPILWDRDATGG